jgi:FAD/FMN-containing dehydrogenase
VLDLLRALRKDTGGYDLKQCFIGAEGTLGVITAACCRLHPAPRGFGTAFAAVPDADAALDLLGELRHRSGDALTGFELIPAIGLEMVVRHVPGVRPPLDPQTSPWYALIELTSFDSPADAEERLVAGLEAATGRGWVIDAAVAAGEGQRQAFWKLRDAMSAAQKREGASIKHDVSVPLSRLAEFIRDGESLVAERVPGARLVAFGHVGDGNVHFNVSEPVGGDRAAFLAVRENLTAAVHDLVARYGGSFSAEHGVGQLKNAELARYRSPAELALMRSLKAMFDPDGIMNPGKVLPAG